MINLLESILFSYKHIRRVLSIKKQQSKLMIINEQIVAGLVRLLKPFKDMLKLIQTGNSPSLFMVLICNINIKKTLASFKALKSYSSPRKNDDQDIEDKINDDIEDVIESEGEYEVFKILFIGKLHSCIICSHLIKV